MNRIELSLNPNGEWRAHFVGEHAKEVIALFGTDTLPTPYTSYSKPEAVRQAIAAINPGVSVEVRL